MHLPDAVERWVLPPAAHTSLLDLPGVAARQDRFNGAVRSGP